jgi:hypothetical protein
MYKLILALLCVSVSCTTEGPVPPPPSVEVVQPLPTPRVDLSMSHDSAVDEWEISVGDRIRDLQSISHPENMFPITDEFDVGVEVLIGDPNVWNAGWQPEYLRAEEPVKSQVRTLGEAQALESSDLCWKAVGIYVSLEMPEDALRCGHTLFDKGEYKVAAMTGVLVGDMKLTTDSTTKLLDADQPTRAKDIVSYAVRNGHVKAARHVATTHGWVLADLVKDHLMEEVAMKGDVDAQESFIVRGLKAVSDRSARTQSDDMELDTVTWIVLFSKSNPEQAREYAAEYLKNPGVNIFVSVSDEEMYEASAVQGSLDFWDLIKDDPELKDLYFAHIRQFFDDVWPVHTGKYVDHASESVIIGAHGTTFYDWHGQSMQQGLHDYTNLLYSHLWMVRQKGDPELIEFWVNMIDGLTVRCVHVCSEDFKVPVFEREAGRAVLGRPFDYEAKGLSLTQRYLLARIAGEGPPNLDSIWEQMASVGRYNVYGSDYGIEWLFALLTQGRISEKNLIELLDENNIDSGSLESLRSNFVRSVARWYEVDFRLKSLLDYPFRAARVNMAAAARRPDYDNYPDSKDEAWDIVGGVLARLEKELPIQHRDFVRRNGTRHLVRPNDEQ